MSNAYQSSIEAIRQQAASVLLNSVIKFLSANNLSPEWIRKALNTARNGSPLARDAAKFRKMIGAYEDLGIIVSTWFVNPKYLDASGTPRPLNTGRGSTSIESLVRASRVGTSALLAIKLLRQSPSIKIDEQGNMYPTTRVFILPGFDLPRAALVIERYLETSRGNASSSLGTRELLLDRNCHVPKVNLRNFAPIMRDIKERGTAFMDSVDGEIDSHRLTKRERKGTGDVDVFVFAWTSANRKVLKKKPKRISERKRQRTAYCR